MLAWPAAAPAAQHTISMVVAASPGTGVDILARAIGQQFATRWGVAAVVDNRPGASGNIGADHVARAKPDGATLLVAATTFATNAAVNQSLPYDPVKDFTPVALLGTGTLCLVVPASFPASTLAEFVAAAKATPGAINYASPGNGTPQHLAMELFKQEAGIDLFHVPFKGTGGAINDLSGGHVSAMIAPLHTVLPLVKGEKLKILGVMSTERVAPLPQVPTFRELGYDKVQVDVWYGLLAPAGTPAAVVDRLNQQVNEALKAPEVVASLAKQGIEPQGGTPGRMAEVLATEIKRWPPVVRAAQIKAD
ncbi:MAG: tripartite tricarboxylate transporter substrate binding protein [Pigmentiphaga sp.]|uniref:tripartite tricarboxylate transporter substrate binding protein n=1 Tax=Pigmentiphaga sp. TaxID=1977564 RepID=UPI0029B400B5|nr:tripartite tricarboxylate transporter substrate binding protein [Pigmentiphaga sp.]MDX3904864.1 tripartite tricarboxylate transporter substrate binding protein [Pigmentiphaga sp.]